MCAVRTARAEGAETMCTTVRRHDVLPISLCAVLPLLLLAGCGGTEPLAAESAVAHYDAVAGDLVEALESQGLDVGLAPATRLVAERDGRCAYDAGTWIPARSVEDALRSEDGWGPWIAAAEPVLAEHGFETVDAPEHAEGMLRIRTTDRHGAELTLDMTGQLRIWDAEVDAAPCDQAALGL